jgi:pimeloyl-ACP methyl ester carboxylesterase
MIFKIWGNKKNKIIVLLHGGGLSWWSNQEIIESLKNSYYIVAVVIDGHGEDADKTFISIENSTARLIDYIDNELNGKVYALIGLSLGSQIIVEAISQKNNITEYAIVESALVCPMKFIGKISSIMIKSSYGLIRKRWFSRIQAKELCLPKDKWDLYFEDSVRISKQSLINMSKSNSNYKLKKSISYAKTKVLLIVGEKEIRKIIQSAKELNAKLSNSQFCIAKNMKHGELSLSYTQKYIEIINSFLRNEYTDIKFEKRCV